MKVAFKALLKKFTPITLVSGDKQVSINLQLNDEEITEDVLNSLNSFYMRTPKLIMIVMMEEKQDDTS